MIQNIFEAVKSNMLSMIKYSKEEYQQFKKTKNIIYLQQAGEKLFNALENYIQYINKIQARNFYEIKSLIKERPLRQLLYDAQNLHRFFYNGELEMNTEDVADLYDSVLKRVEERIKRI